MRVKKGTRGGVRLVTLCAALLFLCLTVLMSRNGDTSRLSGSEGLPVLLLQSILERGGESPDSTAELLLGRLASADEDSSCVETVAQVEEPAVEDEGPLPEQETEEEQAPPEPAIAAAGLLEAPETEEEVTAQVLFSPENYEISPGDLQIYNDTSIPNISLGDYLGRDLDLELSEEGPQILIMHTHGTEAYTMADGDNYTPSDPARTTDENYNMIRIGEEMKAVFEEMGLSVIHDKTLYDYPSYTGSYARSLEGIKSILEQYPTISVVLDVHRDALVDSAGNAVPVTTTLDGENAAQVMLVVGTEDAGLTHPNWEGNLAAAAEIQRQMMALSPDFPRALNLRSQRFNQHMAPGSLLVEVGTSGNTLQEAIRGARAFARAAGTVYLREREAE
ncbi:MAG: stage II sporulation protein P [Oscillospiraceae bacterium]|nr:stage II sporulation protein P [Oscillospiraceae bacterium]